MKRVVTVGGVILGLAVSPAMAWLFDFSGDSPMNGPTGNIRTFSADGIFVNVSGWDRDLASQWSPAYLGAYPGGLGVTNGGRDDSHAVDNTPFTTGWDEFVLFEFSQPVILSAVRLNYVGNDSDFSLFAANLPDVFSNHLDLTSPGTRLLFDHVEDDLIRHGFDRWAAVNESGIAATAWILNPITHGDWDGNDSFKIGALSLHRDVADSGATVAMFSGSLALIAALRRAGVKVVS